MMDVTEAEKEEINTPNASYPDLENRLDKYMGILFARRNIETQNVRDFCAVEFFGVMSLTDVRSPRRKLWYMYYSTSDQVDITVDRIHRKYGQKNMYDLFRKPIFSGAGLRSRVKNHFAALKWYVKGNILEAPPDTLYNDEKVINTITDLYFVERRWYYDFIMYQNLDFNRCRVKQLCT
ncbi:uncharacterized protein LOC113565043 [Drosophila persimilis]|uniref:uncharacterized protein LOC113565043 n=1 Tax=Drosophila persimilis TaxID=7234 RepID=UPI000F08BDF8|nr:uncharacterized protein LOC113565043 [Drosophila persimilis]